MDGYLKNDGLYKNNMIINENYAKDFLQLPGIVGRDTNDFEFYKNNNIEYLKLPTVKDEFISEDAIKEFNISNKKVQLEDSNTKWFKVSKFILPNPIIKAFLPSRVPIFSLSNFTPI